MQLHVFNAAKALCLMAAAIMSHALVWGGVANAAGRVTWATGGEFQQRLAQPVDILWSSNPLRGAIESGSLGHWIAAFTREQDLGDIPPL